MTTTRRWLGLLVNMLPALAALALLTLLPKHALEGARCGLGLCADVIIPSLFPFSVAASLLGELGLTRYVGRLAEPFMSRVFGVGGGGAAAFVLGISGGYPLGAAAVSDLYRRGECGREEAERLLAFCNNSGPAFIVGAAGAGVFDSSAIGIVLFVSHILAALAVALILNARAPRVSARRNNNIEIKALGFPEAFSAAVKSACASALTICGLITFFSVIISVLDGIGIFTFLAGILHELTGVSYGAARALLTGLIELGSGVGALSGLGAYPHTIALCAFILSWGGISVHCQTIALAAGSGLSLRLHFFGRLMCGAIAASIAGGLSFLCL